jgi:hypothetical protein
MRWFVWRPSILNSSDLLVDRLEAMLDHLVLQQFAAAIEVLCEHPENSSRVRRTSPNAAAAR